MLDVYTIMDDGPGYWLEVDWASAGPVFENSEYSFCLPFRFRSWILWVWRPGDWPEGPTS